MSSNSININWSKYEIALLIETYQLYKSGVISRKDAIKNLSDRLRARMASLGMSMSDTFRNESGISLQMSAMEYILTNGKGGIDHPSKSFYEIANLYTEGSNIFSEILAIAHIMFPNNNNNIEPKTDFHLDNWEKKSSQPTQQYQSQLIAEPRAKYVNTKIKKLLEKRFEGGYRLASHIECKRFMRFFKEEYGYELNMEMADIDEDVKACGIVHEKRVYLPELMLNEEIKQNLIEYVKNFFDSGKDCCYYSVIFHEFHDIFLDNQIFDEQMLREYLEYNNNYGWIFRVNYLTNSLNTRENILKEVIDFVKNQGAVVSEDEVVKSLTHLPEESVRDAFCERNVGLVSCGRKQRFHIDNFVLTDEELERVADIINKSITLCQYISFSELIEDISKQIPSIIDNNSVFTDIGIRKVIAIKLDDQFSFVNNLISSKNHPINTEDAFLALAHRDKFTMDDVISLAKECDSLANVYIELLLRHSVRVNKDDFVSSHFVSFKTDEIDQLLMRICKNDYIALNEVDTLSIFPDCGYPWTTFLLESYVFNHSKLFRLEHAKYFNQTVALGGIVKMHSNINNFNTMIAQSVIDDNIPLNKEKILDYMCEKKFIGRRSYKELQTIIDKAREIMKTNLTNK